MSKHALITGISGQDGTLLCEFLLSKGYTVHGWTRALGGSGVLKLRERVAKQSLVAQAGGLSTTGSLQLHELKSSNIDAMRDFLRTVRLDEIYNLSSQSHVGTSFESPTETFAANSLFVLHLLESLRGSLPGAVPRFFQASSAAIFEGTLESPQTERTRLAPRSPYGVAKASAHMIVEMYRETYGLYACSGILYNHESSLRSVQFVTGKIVDFVARIALGREEKLTLGNVATGRDWGAAVDYVRAMWMMLQNEIPEDFIIATGLWHSLTEFLEIAFQTVGLNWQDYTEIDSRLTRRTEPVKLVGDPSAIELRLGWHAEIRFETLIESMVRERILTLRHTE